MFWEGNIDGKKVVVFSNVNSLSCMEIKEYTMGTMGMNLLWNEESKIFLTAEELEKLKKEAAEGDRQAIATLACFYLYEPGTEEETAIYYLKKAAELQDPQGMRILGDVYCRQEKFDKAIYWFTRSAELGNTYAMMELGDLYTNGMGVEQDTQKGHDYYMKAAMAGNVDAMEVLADRYYGGFNTDCDYAAALMWYKRVLRAGSETVTVQIGDIYETGGYGVVKDEAKAIAYYKKAADAGEAEGMYALGRFYTYRATPDFAKALYWYGQAADKHYAMAMVALSNAARFGRGMERDFDTFVYWAREAAKQHHKLGYFFLNNAPYCYNEVDTLPYNSKEAQQKLKEKGDGEALYILGLVTAKRCSAKDQIGMRMAVSYWERALLSGYQKADLELGLYYYYKDRSKKSNERAFTHLKRAAAHGFTCAMYPLAVCYVEGRGTGADLDQYLYWLHEAAEAGDPKACYLLGRAYEGNAGLEVILHLRGDVDKKKAFALFEKAAVNGSIAALKSLGEYYLQGLGGVAVDQRRGQDYLIEYQDLTTSKLEAAKRGRRTNGDSRRPS